jgi:peptidoglycan/LPS O-acetylase OafA/YrhL
VAAFVLAFISWRWVEKPFRNRNWLSQKQVLWSALGCSLILIALGSGLVLGDGFGDRF